MKNIYFKAFIIGVILLFPQVGFAQQPTTYCGAKVTPELEQQVKDFAQRYYAERSGMPSSRSSLTYVPIKIHIVGTDNGSGYYPLENLWVAMCELNKDYDSTNLHFYIYGDINYIDNTNYYDYSSYAVGSQMMSQNNVNDVINAYINNNPAGACGYYTPSNDAVALRKTCMQPGDHTFAHEIGHFFSLLHPFYNSANGSNPEYVDGSNCSSAGDYLCDTRADYLDYRWSCPYTGNQTDPKGDTIDPDETLFMSYSYDNCQSRFSPSQRTQMIDNLNQSRQNLLTHPEPDHPDLDSAEATMLHPVDDTNDVPPNYAILQWNEVEGAKYYHVRDAWNVIDTLVTDTSMVIDYLQTNTTYYWTVKPIHPANTCAEFPAYDKFLTSKNKLTIIPDFSVQHTTCASSSDGAIDVNSSGGTPPYSYQWSNGSTGSSITGLSSGRYYVTITDNGGDTTVLPVDVGSPPPIQFNIETMNDSAIANVTGGKPGYSYQWSTGSTDNVATGLDASSSYTLTVTDAKGCQVDTTFSISSTEDISQEGEHQLNVYPNPVHRDQLHLDYNVAETTNTTIVLYNKTGQRVFTKEVTLNAGKHQLTIPTDELSNGFYLLSIQGEQTTINRKVVVIK